MNEQTTIHKLVNNFVADLQAVFHNSAINALKAASNGHGKIGKVKLNGAKLNGNGHSNGHGGKRSQEDIDRLSEMFIAYVTKNPGHRIEQANKELGTTTKELALPIRKLIADKQLKTKGKRRSTAYFPVV